ncbi:MAG: DUF2784 domain-containing protein [Caulobacteraceae bacterium]
MRAGPHPVLAEAVLIAHLAVIAFNVFGLFAIPLGAWQRWRFVRAPGWRLLHLASMAAVALQALAGRACFLTLLEDRLAGATGAGPPLIMSWVNRVIFWPLPGWVFTALYGLVFTYVVMLLKLVPPAGKPSAPGSRAKRGER